MPPVVIAAAVLVIANLVMVAVIVVRRWWEARRGRRHDELKARLRRPAVELLDADPPPSPPSLDGAEAEVFAELLAEYSQRLRGAPRERIVTYFETSGMFDEQVRRLSSRWSSRRAAAAFLLGDIGSPPAVPHLVPRLGDRSRDVRAAASRSLGRLRAVDAIEPLITAGVDGVVPMDVSNLALLDLGPTAVGRLVELVDHEKSSVRASAVRLIGLLGGANDVDPILDRLTDPAAAVRSASASTLGRLGAGEARDALIVALGDRVPAVRTAAAEALGQLGGRHAAEALLPVARNDAFEPARAAAEALARIDPVLVKRMGDDPDAGPHLREAADRVSM
jgi:hypothetical protein